MRLAVSAHKQLVGKEIFGFPSRCSDCLLMLLTKVIAVGLSLASAMAQIILCPFQKEMELKEQIVSGGTACNAGVL